MPISHEGRFIFIHVPKTAGSSVIEALQTHGAGLDFNRRNVLPRLLTHPRGLELFRRLRHIYSLNSMADFPEQHLPASILRDMVPPEVWSDYFKFTFVRNPWDLVVSTYHFFKHAYSTEPVAAALEPDFAYIIGHVDFTNYVRSRPFFTNQGGFLPQIADAAGNLLVDFVGRVETIDEDFREICRRLGMDVPLPHANKAPHAQYREYYTPETQAIVAQEFARDIEVFGYTF